MGELKDVVKKIIRADFVYIIGNGGSASTANHFANDLVKMAGIKAISLCANEAIVMAYANDNGYENVFSEQLKVFFNADKDLLITISGSGRSANIVKAVEYVNNIADDPICQVHVFPTMFEMDMSMQEIEDYHLKLSHELATILSKK